MEKTFAQLLAVWKKLGINQKVTILLMMGAAVAGLAGVVYVSRRPSYELLYADLEEKEMAQVVDFLKESKVPFRVAAGGRAIMVPEGSKYDLRLSLANKGIATNGHVGLELWESPGWGASPLAERMMKRRALQGELARTIMHIEQVAWADVQIAQPEPSLFVEDRKPVTAAITLKLKPGRTLRPDQVAGICRLVAGSVEGLEPDNVTVIDEQGNLLSRPRSDAVSAAASDLQEYQRNYEEYLAAKAQALLDRALGPGRSVVRVSAILDMDRISETRETYDAESRVPLTEKIVSKSTTGQTTSSSQSEEVTETTYQVPKTVRTVQNAPGSVKQLHVALAIDPTFTGEDGQEKTLSQDELDKLATLVKRAVGLDETRQDTFQMTALPFIRPPRPDTGAALEKDRNREYVLQIVKYASSALGVLIFVGFAALALRRISRAMRSAPAAPAGTAYNIGLDLTGLEGGNGQAELRHRVREVMARDPVTAARVIQRWLAEQEKG